MNKFPQDRLELLLNELSDVIQVNMTKQLDLLSKTMQNVPRYLFHFDYREYTINSIETGIQLLDDSWTTINPEFQVLSNDGL